MSEKPSQNEQLPNNDVILEGIQKTLQNTHELLEDAKLLRASGRFPRAIALAVLALEELGKLERFPAIFIAAKEHRLRGWWKDFRSHESKASFFSMNSVLFADGQDRAKLLQSIQERRSGQFLHSIKMRCLYIDFVNGKFSSPADLTGAEGISTDLISLVEQSLEFDRQYVSRLTADTLGSNDEAAAKWLKSIRAGEISPYEFLATAMDLIRKKMQENSADQP